MALTTKKLRDNFKFLNRRARSRQSLGDAAYEAIKHSIITCKYKPGECINEAAISESLGFGRTPVNTALDRLMLEEMVEVIPRKGIIVKSIVLEDVLQTIDVRLVNEAYCARLAAQRADDSHIAKLGEILNRARRALSEGHIHSMMMLDREFHGIIANATKNPELTAVLRKLSERLLRFWFISFAAPEQIKLQQQHEAVFDAICKRDEAAAEAAMRAHIESIRKFVVRQL
jgi:DNA-binding GntR family transcriptional regulator